MGRAQPKNKKINKTTGRSRPKMNLGRDQPNNFFGLGQDRPRRACWARTGPDVPTGPASGWPSMGSPARGRINFLPPARLLHATCRRRKNVNEKTKRKKAGEGGVPGVEEAVDGGAAVAWLVDGGPGRRRCGEKFLPLPPFFLPFSVASVWFFGFRFRFICFRFIATLPSISFVLSLSSVSSLSPVSPPKKSSLLSPSVSPFIEKNMEQVCFSCVPSITQRLVGHWGEFGGGGGEERETRENFRNFSCLFC